MPWPMWLTYLASGKSPWDELAILREELEKYQPGISSRARIVVANKADLLASNQDVTELETAKKKLLQLENLVRTKLITANGKQLDVVPVSAKFTQNLNRLVVLM